MPWQKVFSKFKHGALHSGSKSGPVVKSKAQAIAIAMSEKRKAKTNPEYAQHGKTNVGLALFRARLAQSKRKR